MLEARLWTLSRGEPRWPDIQAAWRAAEQGRALCETLAGRLSEADTVRVIGSGHEGFALRDALYRAAERSIDISTYYIVPDDTGRRTMAALTAAAARGIRVRLLVDRGMMANKSVEIGGMAPFLAEAEAAGILRMSHDPRRPFDSNHRKILLIDDRTAIVGGRNFADHYREDEWRDVDLVVEGPSVGPLAGLFEALWNGAGWDRWSTPLPWVDSVPRDIVADPIMRGVLSAIGQARHTVDLELAYFVAHDSLCGALARASARGVRVRLLTNSAESNDLPYGTWAAYDGARRVLETGGAVHVRRGSGRTLHSKYVVVDKEWVSVGSHNLDYYSPRYCCETHLVVRDRRLASLLTTFFDSGVDDATPLSLDDEVRPFLRRQRARRAFDRVFRDFQ